MRVQLADQFGEQFGLAASTPVQFQRDVGVLAERGQGLGDHRRVLAGGDEHRTHPAGEAHPRGDRGELDGFGTGTGEEVNFGELSHDGGSSSSG